MNGPTRRAAACVALLLCAASGASGGVSGGALPRGHGVEIAPGESVRSYVLGAHDVDDYVVDAVAGSRVVATLDVVDVTPGSLRLEFCGLESDTSPKGDHVRYSGHAAAPGDEDRAHQSVRARLGSSGRHKLRVRSSSGPAPVALEYTLRVHVTPPRVHRPASPLADDGVTARTLVPVRGGARATLRVRAFADEFPDPLGIVLRPGDAAVAPTPRSARGRVRSYRFAAFDAALAPGDYPLVFPSGAAGEVRLTWRLDPPGGRARHRRRTVTAEPHVTSGPSPSIGGEGTVITVAVEDALDLRGAAPTLLVGGRVVTGLAVTPLSEPGTVEVSGRVPAGLEDGPCDVTVQCADGAVAVRERAFVHVTPPTFTSIEPGVLPLAGGTVVTLHGEHLRPGHLHVTRDGVDVDVVVLDETPRAVRFVAPPAHVGLPHDEVFGVRDDETGLRSASDAPAVPRVSGPLVLRVEPGLTTLLGGELVRVIGAQFEPTDRVLLETTTPGRFEIISLTESTYRDTGLHEFTAPVRPRGRYALRVVSGSGSRPDLPDRTLAYFDLADVALPAVDDIPAPVTTELADVDGDGDTDVLVASHRTGAATSASQLRLLLNDGSGELVDVTAERLPPAGADDDWRADRVRVADVTGDGRADIVLTTADPEVPAATRSHTRVLVAVAPSTGQADPTFVDRSATLIAAATPLRGPDDWRGLDLWIGELDESPGSRPDIVILDDATSQAVNVPDDLAVDDPRDEAYSVFTGVSAYWGGVRVLSWDAAARGGRGSFRPRRHVLPHRVRLYNPGYGAPGHYDECNPSHPCRGTFTPFTGRTLVVRDLDGDDRMDVVVLSDQEVVVDGVATSPVQVALSRPAVPGQTILRDVTPQVFALRGTAHASAAAIVRPDRDVRAGVLALVAAEAPPGGARALELLRYVTPQGGAEGRFEDVTTALLPATGDDAFEATAIAAHDVDADGHEDLVLLAQSPPAPGRSALRVLRSVADAASVGRVLTADRTPLLDDLAGGGDALDGSLLAIGDLGGDGTDELVVTRTGAGPRTLAVTLRTGD